MTTNAQMFTRIEGSLAVMAVTVPRDEGYSSPSRPSAYFELCGRCKMQKDERVLLEVLKFELQFLEDGGYGRSPRTPWRPQYIFEDYITCVIYDSKENRGPCSDCVLMQPVPPEHRSEKIPCRHIPFNTSGENLDSLYRYGNQQETEETVGAWLRATIQRLEEERAAARQAHSKQPPSGGGTVSGTPLYQKQHPKCANPACASALHLTGGGKFFRVRPHPVPSNGMTPKVDSPGGIQWGTQ